MDLVGINLQQEYPIIKAVDYNKLLYDESKKKSVKGTSGKVNTAQVRKEFQFKVRLVFPNRKDMIICKSIISSYPYVLL